MADRRTNTYSFSGEKLGPLTLQPVYGLFSALSRPEKGKSITSNIRIFAFFKKLEDQIGKIRISYHFPNFQIRNMLPDKRPRLIFFLYFITIAQYNSKIYRKIGYTWLKQSAYKFSSLYLLHLPAILNITKRAFRPRFGACSQKYSGLDQNCMRPVMRQFLNSEFKFSLLHTSQEVHNLAE